MTFIRTRGKNQIYHIRYYSREQKREIEFSTGLSKSKENLKKVKQLVKGLSGIEFNKRFYKNNSIPLLSEAVNQYINEHNLAKSTRRLIELSGRVIIQALGNKRIDLYNVSEFERLKKQLSISGKTTNTISIYFGSVSQVFNYQIQQKIIQSNPINKIPRDHKQVRIIPDEVMQIILNYLFQHNREKFYLIKFLSLSGWRIGNGIQLKWENIKLKDKVIITRNNKSKNEFLFPISEALAELFGQIGIKESGVVFGRSQNGVKFWYRAIKKLGIKEKYSIHQIRKTFCTKLLRADVSIQKVQKLLDHKDISTTLKYYSAIQTEKLSEELNKIKFC